MAKSSKTPKMSNDNLKMGGVVICVILFIYVLYRMMYGCEKNENFVSKCDTKEKKNKVTYYEKCLANGKNLKCCDSDSGFNCPPEYDLLLNTTSGTGKRGGDKSGCKLV